MAGFSATGRATSLQHVLKNVLECDLTSPLYLSVLQHFGGDEDKFNCTMHEDEGRKDVIDVL
jgi:hypothetical protein